MKMQGFSEIPPEVSTNGVNPGLYRHFKGGEYEVLCIAINRDTGQKIVVYCKQGSSEIEYRTVEEFTQNISRDQYVGPRFFPM